MNASQFLAQRLAGIRKLALAIAVLAPVGMYGAVPAAAADAFWPVQLQGATNGQSFAEAGCLHIRVPGYSAHLLDYSLVANRAGSYGTLPGPLQFATNSALLGGPNLDTTVVSTSLATNGGAHTDALPIAALASNSGNLFAAGSNTFSSFASMAQWSLINSGKVSFTTSNGVNSGQLNVGGPGILGFFLNTNWLIAGFSGRFNANGGC